MLMQEIAWVNMLWDYTAENGFVRGVTETFDGSRPCELCKKADDLRQQEHRNDPVESNPDSRARMAWAEMVPAVAAAVPAIRVSDALPAVTVPPQCLRGRGADAPVPPPPKRA